jgi:hypothetical protein
MYWTVFSAMLLHMGTRELSRVKGGGDYVVIEGERGQGRW